MRPPIVAGISAGAGTSTVAAALHARDGGRRAGGADVVVCRADEGSLRRAATAMAGPGPRPVLAVRADALGRGAHPAALRLVQPHVSAVVVLPTVSRWHGLTEPCGEAITLLAQPVEYLPHTVRAYVEALHLVVAAVVRSGRLTQPEQWPRTVRLWPGLGPVERGVGPMSPLLAAREPVHPRRAPTPTRPARRPAPPRRLSTASTLPPRWVAAAGGPSW